MDQIIRLKGTVVHGKGAGHLHDMPTANLAAEGALPEAGVYGGYAFADGKRCPCVTNIGTRPSDDSDPTPTVETMLLDFSGDLYGKTLLLELHFFLRPIRRFAGGLDAVAAQVRLDSEETRRRLAAEESLREPAEATKEN